MTPLDHYLLKIILALMQHRRNGFGDRLDDSKRKFERKFNQFPPNIRRKYEMYILARKQQF